jgi:predicted metal-dependent hydrolase
LIDQSLRYGDLDISYQVLFVPGRQCKIAIHVHPNGRVQVDAPPKTSLADIKQAVSKRSRWLCNHIERIQQQRASVLPREYVSGESHYYLGRRYVLKVREIKRQQPSVKLWRGMLYVETDDVTREVAKNLLWEWYKEHARNQFDRRLDALSQEISWIREKPAFGLHGWYSRPVRQRECINNYHQIRSKNLVIPASNVGVVF